MYGTPLTAIPLFKYLGQTLVSSDNDWTAAEHNLRRAQGKRTQLVNILGREGEDRRTAGIFYVKVVQAVLLFGS